MAVRIGTNPTVLRAQRMLNKSTDQIALSYERLASGSRINRAADDAAGLAIATALRSDSRVATAAIRNVNDGISATRIAEGALHELISIVTRQRELATQAANGVYSLAQRKPLYNEANQLTKEFNRIVETTKFNGVSLLDGDAREMSIQLGYSYESFGIGTELQQRVGDGTLSAGTVYTPGGTVAALDEADVNRDGKLDLVLGSAGTMKVLIGNGDGSFVAPVAYTSVGNVNFLKTGDFNRDGIVDVVSTSTSGNRINLFIGNGDGSFRAAVTYVTPGAPNSVIVTDLNNDSISDLAIASRGTGQLTTLLGNGDGSFRNGGSYTAIATFFAIASGDINGDGNTDIVGGNFAASEEIGVLFGRGDGSFSSPTTLYTSTGTSPMGIALVDTNHDGNLDILANAGFGRMMNYLGNGNGTFRAPLSNPSAGAQEFETGDFNGDGYVDYVTATDGVAGLVMMALGNGDGTFKLTSTRSVSYNYEVVAGDFTGDGVSDVVVANDNSANISFYAGQGANSSNIGILYLLTQEGARSALGQLDAIDRRLSAEMGKLGTHQTRLEVASRNLLVNIENMRRAESRIVDIDVAEESATLVRQRILQQVGQSVLAQANILPQLALDLIKNA